MLSRKILIVWLSIFAFFLVLLFVGICAITIVTILLDLPTFAIIFLITSSPFVFLLSYFWKNVYLLCKDIENDNVYALNNII